MVLYFKKKKRKKMNLQKFISNSLVQIIDGIHDAQMHCGKNVQKDEEEYYKAIIAPLLIQGSEKNYTRIEFDVAVTITNNDTNSVESYISVVPLGIGGKSSLEQINSSVSRVKFAVPIIYPSTPNKI